jgi:hypothetical protein
MQCFGKKESEKHKKEKKNYAARDFSDTYSQIFLYASSSSS